MPTEDDKHRFRWRVFWIGVVITIAIAAALDVLNPFGLFSSLGS